MDTAPSVTCHNLCEYAPGIQYVLSHNLFKKSGKIAVHLFPIEALPRPAYQIRFFS